MKLLGVLALSTTPVFAIDRIVVPETVNANTDVDITLKNDLGRPDSFDAQFAFFRLYLTISPPGWGLNPVCWLANQTTTETTSVTVRVPASVGPNGDNYTISSIQYNTDPNAESSSSGFLYSDEFELVGGTGIFSAFETDPSGPWSLGNMDQIPCSAYDCVRQCKQKYWSGDGTNPCGDKKSYLCSAQCEGVTYDSWDPAWDDMDEDGVPDFECDVGITSTGTAAATTGARPTRTATTSAAGSTATTTTTDAVASTTSPAAAGDVGVSRGVLAGGLVMALAGWV